MGSESWIGLTQKELMDGTERIPGPPRKLRLLLLLTSTAGGAGQHAYQLASMLPRDEFDITVAYGPGYPLDESLQMLPDVMNHELPLSRELAPLQNLSVIRDLRDYMLQKRFDIVCMECSVAGFVGRWASWLARVPVRVFVLQAFASHAHQPPASRRAYWFMERMVRPMTTHFVAVSKAMRDFGIAQRLVPASRVSVIHNSVSMAAVSDVPRDTVVRELGFPADAQVVGTLARFEPQKGLEYFLEAAKLVKDARPNVRFLVVGDGPLRPTLEKQRRHLGLDDTVHFAGWRQDATRVIRAMDIFCLSSRWESFGMALAEAMANGLPTVATAVDGVPEVVEDGVTGLLVPSQDAPALAKALLALLGDPARCAAMGVAGLARVERLFTASMMVQQYRDLFCRLAKERGVR